MADSLAKSNSKRSQRLSPGVNLRSNVRKTLQTYCSPSEAGDLLFTDNSVDSTTTKVQNVYANVNLDFNALANDQTEKPHSELVQVHHVCPGNISKSNPAINSNLFTQSWPSVCFNESGSAECVIDKVKTINTTVNKPDLFNESTMAISYSPQDCYGINDESDQFLQTHIEDDAMEDIQNLSPNISPLYLNTPEQTHPIDTPEQPNLIDTANIPTNQTILDSVHQSPIEDGLLSRDSLDTVDANIRELSSIDVNISEVWSNKCKKTDNLPPPDGTNIHNNRSENQPAIHNLRKCSNHSSHSDSVEKICSLSNSPCSSTQQELLKADDSQSELPHTMCQFSVKDCSAKGITISFGKNVSKTINKSLCKHKKKSKLKKKAKRKKLKHFPVNKKGNKTDHQQDENIGFNCQQPNISINTINTGKNEENNMDFNIGENNVFNEGLVLEQNQAINMVDKCSQMSDRNYSDSETEKSTDENCSAHISDNKTRKSAMVNNMTRDKTTKSNLHHRVTSCLSKGEVTMVKVGASILDFFKKHSKIQGIYLNKGKRFVKKLFVTLQKHEESMEASSWHRKNHTMDRNHYDDKFELTEEGLAKQRNILARNCKDIVAVNWYLWCPGRGNCRRKCGGIAVCKPGKLSWQL